MAKTKAKKVECPKCGGIVGPPRYCAGYGYACGHGSLHGMWVGHEHLRLTCTICGYGYNEPPRDAKGAK